MNLLKLAVAVTSLGLGCSKTDDSSGSGGSVLVAQDGYSEATLTIAGHARDVSFYAPRARGAHPPLVIAFHGTSGRPTDWISGSDPSGIEWLADQHGFMVAAPASRAMPEGDWDHEYGGDLYWETAAPNGSDPLANEDLMLVDRILHETQVAYGVDTARVYTLGFSNGGFFSVLTAMVLSDRIAAFAEMGSGLVTCDTTRSCTAQSSSTDCATILAASGCACSGPEKPATVPTDGRRVPGFLAHNNQDDTVSVVYTCSLHLRMTELGYQSSLLIGDASGHGMPEGALPEAWSFLSGQALQ